ncbi:MAG: hydroxymethylglutaryl-CoA reductase (NADPH) [Desulfurococcales archaeon]|jgi:hydroxymethylglutaryl-CoA reductase (NADPH)|nr:hydroxymethylglutaryl-CoA reductase (NADPH) [Desulfurococcales archaeon]
MEGAPERDKIQEILDKLRRGEIRFSEIDNIAGNKNLGAVIRRLYLEDIKGISLSSIGSTIIDFEEVVGRNIENPIGAVQIPLGVAGPLKIVGEHVHGDFYIPLATTEGALVASISRGAKAITLSGGAFATVYRDGMTRAPLFKTANAKKAVELAKWVLNNIEDIKKVAESTTRYGKLVAIEPYIAGNNVWLRFKFTTGDAMGMNMVTMAVDKAAKYIEEKFGETELVALSGNMCVDKKPAYINSILGRGKSVVAEAVIKKDVVSSVLKTSVNAMVDVNSRKNLLGTAMAGGIGLNAHVANVIAAIFIATGQDVAQVVESSIAYTWMEETLDGDLYASVTLPSLEVGTVGGGTWLPTQKEALSLLGVYGSGDPPGINSVKFAEIVASAALAGEVNLVAALASDQLARAHERLGRKRH